MARKISRQLKRYRNLVKGKRCPRCGGETNGRFYCETHRKADAALKKKKYDEQKKAKVE